MGGQGDALSLQWVRWGVAEGGAPPLGYIIIYISKQGLLFPVFCDIVLMYRYMEAVCAFCVCRRD